MTRCQPNVCNLLATLALGACLAPVWLASTWLAPAWLAAHTAQAQDKQQAVTNYQIGHLKQQVEKLAPLSRLDNPLEDDGFAGSRLGINDNNASGRFLKQNFVLSEQVIPVGGDAVGAALAMAGQGIQFLIVDAPAETLLKIADALKTKDILIFNAASPDSSLRDAECRANVMHTAPSRAMLADGLAQYLVWKKWNKWFLVHGALPGDLLYADAIRRAAKRFGAKIVAEKQYIEQAGARRTDSGHEQVQAQMPLFTQDAPDYDVLIVADENEVFGPYLPYRTWQPRPVAGTSGLVPDGWHPANEQWGATQFQNRFQKLAKRVVRSIDYYTWIAVRAVGEAATRTRSADFKALRDYLRSPDLTIAAFKGQALNFRPWNGQLRHTIVLGNRHLPVTWSPQPGFLHQVTQLDTLGIDKPETKCRF